MIKGIDVSKWEPVIDWQKVADQNIRFVFVKASQGAYKDTSFSTHWKNSKGVMPRGAYHFYYPWTDPKRQAEAFYDALDDDWGELPFVVDIEAYKDRDAPYFGWKRWYDYLERLKELAPSKEIMIYTGFYYWKDYGPAWWDLPRHTYFAQYPLWLASYSQYTPEQSKYIPLRGWNEWLFWQYDENEILDGVKDGGHLTSVDTNYFNGDEAKFAELFGSVIPPIIDEPGEDMETKYTGIVVATRGANIRPAPTTNNVKIRTVLYNTKLTIADILTISEVEEWAQLTTAEWIATKYGGEKIVDYQAVGEPSGELPDIPVKVVLGDNITYYQQEFTATLKPVK